MRAEWELNGDLPLSPLKRFTYLARNLRRNMAGLPRSVPFRPFCRGRVEKSDGTPSPTRLLGQVFIREELPRLLPTAEIRVLDVGCGTGRMSDLLERAGYRGTYVGVDIDDRFARDGGGTGAFARHFVHGDAHDLTEADSFDLVFSNSALEHIPNDRRLLAKLDELVAPGGMQVHIVPSGWGLPLYLWHGYRQYPLSRIGSLFPGEGTRVYGLGGLACFGVHLAFISLGEILLRMDLRRRIPATYRAFLNTAFRIDRVFSTPPGMYVVCRRNMGDAKQCDEMNDR